MTTKTNSQSFRNKYLENRTMPRTAPGPKTLFVWQEELNNCMINNIEIYRSKNGETSVEVTFDKETVWLNQSQLSELFGRDRSVVGRHIKNIKDTCENYLAYSSCRS